MPADGVDEIDKMRDARWKRADEMESADEMEIWGVKMERPRWKGRASPQTSRGDQCMRENLVNLGNNAVVVSGLSTCAFCDLVSLQNRTARGYAIPTRLLWAKDQHEVCRYIIACLDMISSH